MHRLVGLGVALAAFMVASSGRADEPARLGLDGISVVSAHRAAERLACGSGAARRYLRRTLRHIDTRRWGMVTKTLQEDTVDLVADAVYLGLQQGQPRGDVIRALVPPPAAECTNDDRTEARKVLAYADERPNATEVERCTARPTAERRKDPACSFAAAIRAGLDGDVATSTGYVADVVASAAFDAIVPNKGMSEAHKDALFEHISFELREVLLTESNEETIDSDVLRAFRSVDLDAIRGWRCADSDLVRDLAEGRTDPQDAFCSATRADLRTENVVVTLTGPSGEDRTTNLTSLLHAASARADTDQKDPDLRIGEAVLCAIPLPAKDLPFADCSSGTLKTTRAGAFRLAVAAQGHPASTWTIAVTPGTAKTPPSLRVESPSRLSIAGLVDGTADALRLRANISTLIRDKLLGEEPSNESLRDLATAGLRLRRVARALDDAVAGADPSFILGPIEALPALVPRFGLNNPNAPIACDAPQSPFERIWCSLVRRDEGSLRRIAITAEDGKVRELAARVASLATPHGSTCSGAAGGRLLEAFASQTPDARGSTEGINTLAAEQLRGASDELAQCSPREDSEPVFEASIVPSLALRFSWNNAYYNAWGSDGFRIVPSLDVASARVRLTPRTAGARVDVGISLLDLMAPISELAMRRSDLNYDRQEMVWLDILRPRLDAMFGIPSISRHLALTAGVALRTVAPYRGGSGKPTSTATYLAVGTPGGVAAESFASFVEYNLGVKYSF